MKVSQLPSRLWSQTEKGWTSIALQSTDIDRQKCPELYERIMQAKEIRAANKHEQLLANPDWSFGVLVPSIVDKPQQPGAGSGRRIQSFQDIWDKKKKGEAASD